MHWTEEFRQTIREIAREEIQQDRLNKPEDIIDTTTPDFVEHFKGFMRTEPQPQQNSDVDIPVYHSIEQATLAMQVAIENESEEFDEDEEHAITGRDEVLVGLVKYLAHGHKRILHILDMYCGKSDIVDATFELERSK
jgi:hypothetical protein